MSKPALTRPREDFELCSTASFYFDGISDTYTTRKFFNQKKFSVWLSKYAPLPPAAMLRSGAQGGFIQVIRLVQIPVKSLLFLRHSNDA